MPGLQALYALATLAAFVAPAVAETLCNATNLCPKAYPCCSEYGYCQKGAFCLGGCNPLNSFRLESCMPAPVCESHTNDFSRDLSLVLLNHTLYDGNATKWDWVVDKGEIVPNPAGDGVRMTLTKDGGGTRISSTRYVHYGKMEFVMKSSKWGGIITSAITMSDVKDEIDWEWVGAANDEVQSNYFFLGIVDYENSKGATHKINGSKASDDWHTYTLDWQEDELKWLIDGKVVRSVKKSETATADGQFQYPTTPSRVQLAIWASGIEGTAKGTVEWGGGMVDWQAEDYTSTGYYWAELKSITLECADQGLNSTDGYVYTGLDHANIPTVEVTHNRSTILNAASMTGASMSMLGAAVAVGLLPLALSVL